MMHSVMKPMTGMSGHNETMFTDVFHGDNDESVAEMKNFQLVVTSRMLPYKYSAIFFIFSI